MQITTVDRIALGTITTRDNAGRHFTEIWPDSWLTRMETAGYLTITKPVHEQTGLPYSREHWHVEAAAEVADWFDSHGCLVGHEDLYDESGEYPGDIVEQVEALEAAPAPDLALHQDPVVGAREGFEPGELGVNAELEDAGDLYDYQTGDWIRAATPAELAASEAASETDGGHGLIAVDGQTVYAVR